MPWPPCVHICTKHVHILIHVWIRSVPLSTSMFAWMSACAYVYIHTYHIRDCIYIYIYIYTHEHTERYRETFTCTYSSNSPAQKGLLPASPIPIFPGDEPLWQPRLQRLGRPDHGRERAMVQRAPEEFWAVWIATTILVHPWAVMEFPLTSLLVAVPDIH